ncbi:MAG: tRNA pseudouridine(38-40) synthase TruA [Actinomycetota bacterium]
MPRYMVILEYDGFGFNGFQRQPGLPTVQGALETAIVTYAGEEVRVMGSGRTDAGVHALGQVVAFDLEREVEPEKTISGLNALLPAGVAVTGLREVSPAFDPRRNALWREYRYFILNRTERSPLLAGFTHHVARPLDLDVMRRACSLLPGEHDFSAFRLRSENGSDVREVLECEIQEKAHSVIVFRIRANAFLYRMVRIIAGALVMVGRGRMSVDEFERHLAGGAKPCADALPPQGLLLWEVCYPDESTAWR